MSKNEIMTLIAAILSTLRETGGSPESMLYILCGMDLDKWNYIRGVMGDWIVIKGNYVTLTQQGIVMAIKIDNVMKSAK